MVGGEERIDTRGSLSSRRRALPRLAFGILAALLVVGGGVLLLTPSARGLSAGQPAPTFTLTDIYGHPFVLSSYRNSSVVVIEFTSLSCAECQYVKDQLLSLYSGYNSTGHSQVTILSVYTEPQFGDQIPALRSYHDQNNITWTMAQDTSSDTVSTGLYGVSEIPDVFVIDKQGFPVYRQTGAPTTELQSKISAALQGTAPPIGILTVSVFALAMLAGVTTFFSPCSFPMFPGYMGLFLGMNANRSAEGPASGGGTYKGATRRAALAGSVTALGMLVVIAVIGIALSLAGLAISHYIPDLLLVVAVAVIAIGLLLFTNFSYWRIITPFQNLFRRIRGAGSAPAAAVHPSGDASGGIHWKLFGYGVGYAAAAAGCVAPVIFAAVFAGLALGFVGGLLTILIYAATAAVLMIATTILIAVASKRFINQLKAATPIIKKVSAGVLVAVGVYLVYFYYTAWLVHPA